MKNRLKLCIYCNFLKIFKFFWRPRGLPLRDPLKCPPEPKSWRRRWFGAHVEKWYKFYVQRWMVKENWYYYFKIWPSEIHYNLRKCYFEIHEQFLFSQLPPTYKIWYFLGKLKEHKSLKVKTCRNVLLAKIVRNA